MLYLCEFEIFKGETMFLAFPFGLDGCTQGETFEEACEMAADWLRSELEWRAIHGQDMPAPSLGNEPVQGGHVVLLGVDAGLDTVRKVTASEAARMLSVTPGRVTQMIAAEQLIGWREGHRTWVTLDSVEARLSETHSAGRPKRKATTALRS